MAGLATVQRSDFALIAFAFAVVVTVAFVSERAAFSSSEVAFADGSTSGLAIVPASCPSSPHTVAVFGVSLTNGGTCTCNTSTTLLTENADGKGYRINAQTFDRRISRYGAFFCVENEGATNSYFIPANTQTELDSFRTATPTPSGVNVWGYTVYSQATYYSQSAYYGEGGYWSSGK